MSSKLASIEIVGLLGRVDPVNVKFDQDHNFFVGQNGTGKTTVINLLAAALLCNFERLEKISFESLTINLDREIGGVLMVSVVKSRRKENIVSNIVYAIETDGSRVSFDLDEYAIELGSRAHHMPSLRRQFLKSHLNDARNLVSQHVNVRWLSINRATDSMDVAQDGRHLPAIDRKLQELTNDIAKYFGRLSKSYTDKTTDFQQSSLLSVIRGESKFTFDRFLKEIDIEAEQESLKHAFDALGMPESRYRATLRSHFDDLSKAIAALDEDHSGAYQFNKIYSIYNGWKAHNLVSEYKKLELDKAEIFKPRDIFISTINSLFFPRKEVRVSSRNELIVGVTASDGFAEIEFSELSSGEKQLLIILGEALLQESSSAIYIADEPELSLHVSWQTKITGSIKAINPKAQIVFATHSPDIVNIHSNNIIDMECI